MLLHEYVFSFERTKDTQFALKVIAAHNKSLDEININQIFLDFNACLIKTLPDRSLSGTCREFDYLLNVQSKTHAEILTNIFQQAGMTLVSSPNVIPKEGNKLAL